MAGLFKGIERAAVANPKGVSFSPLAFKRNHVCAMSSKTVMAITDAPSRFWHEQGVMRRLLRPQSEGEPHEYQATPWISRRSDGSVRCSATYNRLFADGVLWVARVGEPSHRESFKHAHADKAHRMDAMTNSALPNPVALRPTWKGNLVFLLVVAVVVLAVAS